VLVVVVAVAGELRRGRRFEVEVDQREKEQAVAAAGQVVLRREMWELLRVGEYRRGKVWVHRRRRSRRVVVAAA